MGKGLAQVPPFSGQKHPVRLFVIHNRYSIDRPSVAGVEMKSSQVWPILKTTFTDFFADKALQLSAALAYYAVFSLGPLLILVISIAGLVYDQAVIQEQVQSQVRALVGNNAAEMIGGMVASPSKGSHGIMAVVGIVVLIFGATGVFGQLQSSLNTIWEVKPKPGRGVWGFVRDRFLSLSMVFGIAFLLLISMVISTALEAFGGFVGNHLPLSDSIAKVLHFGISFAVITALFAMMFRFLPDATVSWRDVWIGAIGTSLLFTVGKFALGNYLGRDSVTSAYGAAGSLVAILLWVYYSSLILFLGAEFTQAYAWKMGSRIVPSANAVSTTDASRAHQGLAPKPAATQPGHKSTVRVAKPTAGTPAEGRSGSEGMPRGQLLLAALAVSVLGGWFVGNNSRAPLIGRSTKATQQTQKNR